MAPANSTPLSRRNPGQPTARSKRRSFFMTRVYISRCQAPSKVHFREVLLSAASALVVACGTSTNAPPLQVAPPVTAAATKAVLGEITGSFKVDDGERHLRVD